MRQKGGLYQRGPYGLTFQLAKTMTPANTSSNIVAKKIRVIGVPLDLGQSRRGVDMGPSAMRVAGLEARLEEVGHVVEDAGNISVAIAEQKKCGRPIGKVSERNHRHLHQECRAGDKDARGWHGSAGAGRGPLGGGGNRGWRCRILSPPEPEDWIDLDRRAHRHQHSREFAQRKCARHAPGCDHGSGACRTSQYFRFLAQGEAGELCAGWRARH